MQNSESTAKFAHLGINQTFKEMSAAKSALNFDRKFPEREYEAIRAGLLSRDMDDKWDIIFDEGWLYFYRSWTGNCIFQTRIEPDEDGYRMVETWVNRNPQQYNANDDNFDVAMIGWLIDRFLLGKDTPCPRREIQPASSI